MELLSLCLPNSLIKMLLLPISDIKYQIVANNTIFKACLPIETPRLQVLDYLKLNV